MQAESSPGSEDQRAPPDTPPPGEAAARSTAANPDLPELQELHLALLRRFDALDPGGKRAEAQVVRETVQAAGEWIELPVDRDTAQGIIDYWTSTIAALPGESFPELLQLTPFEPANLTRLLGHADAVLADLRETGEEDAARLVVLSLTPEVARTGGLVFSVAERAVLESQSATGVRERLMAEGLIRRTAGGEGNPNYVLRHEVLLRHWPPFKVWLTGTEAEGAKLKAAVARAENWEYFKRARAYLLHGRALRDALPYRTRNELVAALIDASKRARWQARISTGVVALAVIGGGWAGYRAIYKEGVLTSADVIFSEDASEQLVSAEAIINHGGEKPARPDAATTVVTGEGEQPDSSLAMWIGNSTVALLLDMDGDPVDPTLVEPGGRYRARADIWLRSGMPSMPAYTSAPEVAVLPRFALVETTSAIRPYERPSGIQYWVGAKRIATIYIHYSGATRATAESLGAKMKTSTFDVPDVQALRTGTGQYEVRYSFPEDAALAQQIADQLLKIAPPGRNARPRCSQLTSRRAKGPGIFEIWIDLGAVRTDPTPTPAPTLVAKRLVSCGSTPSTGRLRAAGS